jgi:hypothetical protein
MHFVGGKEAFYQRLGLTVIPAGRWPGIFAAMR